MLIIFINGYSESPAALSVSAIITPPAPEVIAHTESVDDGMFCSIILPHVILWDPLNQLPHYVSGRYSMSQLFTTTQ